jgi:hypothetical protein
MTPAARCPDEQGAVGAAVARRRSPRPPRSPRMPGRPRAAARRHVIVETQQPRSSQLASAARRSQPGEGRGCRPPDRRHHIRRDGRAVRARHADDEAIDERRSGGTVRLSCLLRVLRQIIARGFDRRPDRIIGHAVSPQRIAQLAPFPGRGIHVLLFSNIVDGLGPCGPHPGRW